MYIKRASLTIVSACVLHGYLHSSCSHDSALLIGLTGNLGSYEERKTLTGSLHSAIIFSGLSEGKPPEMCVQYISVSGWIPNDMLFMYSSTCVGGAEVAVRSLYTNSW